MGGPRPTAQLMWLPPSLALSGCIFWMLVFGTEESELHMRFQSMCSWLYVVRINTASQKCAPVTDVWVCEVFQTERVPRTQFTRGNRTCRRLCREPHGTLILQDVFVDFGWIPTPQSKVHADLPLTHVFSLAWRVICSKVLSTFITRPRRRRVSAAAPGPAHVRAAT